MTEERRRLGRYEVELELGEGLVSRVFVARDPVLGRRVAVKVLRDDLPLNPARRERLAERIRVETRTVAALSHPGLAALHDMGETGGAEGRDGPYLVSEFVAGTTLRERLGAGPLAPGEVAAIGRALGSALAYAHSAGVVFGDVKAENVVVVGPSGTGAKLVEPGFARIALLDTELRGAVPEWASMGLPNAAPELVASGLPSAFTDQFALATMLYEALTGKRPFGAEGSGEPTEREPPSAVRPHLRSFPHLDTIFDRALARDPRKRFSSCDVLASVLANELEGVDVGHPAAPSVSSIVPRATRRWQNAAAGAAVLVILSLVVLGRQRRPSGDEASLTSVASAFAVTIAPPVVPPRAAPASPRVHVPHALPSSVSSTSTAGSTGAAPSASSGEPTAPPARADALPPERSDAVVPPDRSAAPASP